MISLTVSVRPISSVLAFNGGKHLLITILLVQRSGNIPSLVIVSARLHPLRSVLALHFHTRVTNSSEPCGSVYWMTISPLGT